MIAMILAGGSGTRLWPYSRTMSPKQFLNLGSTHESLLQETVRRLNPLIPPEKVYVVGSRTHEFELRQQLQQTLPGLPGSRLLLEPMARNTAPAILWGLNCLPEDCWQEPVVILPADHLIRAESRFRDALEQAAKLAESRYIVTFGIRPDRPETGYGYIQAGAPLEVGFQVERFLEKPDLETAERLIQSPDHTWNSGIFMATPKTLRSEFARWTPELFQAFEEAREAKILQDPEALEALFESVNPDSIDYALMEKSEAVAVLPVEMAWSDLGSWESIFEVSEKDENNNVLRGNVISHDTRNSLIFSSKKLVTSIGVENLIIVETDDALLVCNLDRSQDVKKLVETLKEEERYEYQFHTRVLRPWGSATTLHEHPGYCIRLLEIEPGGAISLQRHRHRSEHFVVLSGAADVVRGEEQFLLTENESIHVPKSVKHRIANEGRIPLQIIEVQQGSYLGADDIERFG